MPVIAELEKLEPNPAKPHFMIARRSLGEGGLKGQELDVMTSLTSGAKISQSRASRSLVSL